MLVLPPKMWKSPLLRRPNKIGAFVAYVAMSWPWGTKSMCNLTPRSKGRADKRRAPESTLGGCFTDRSQFCPVTNQKEHEMQQVSDMVKAFFEDYEKGSNTSNPEL